MQANETLLELWIQALCEDLGEISGTLITVSSAPYEVSHQAAYETKLLIEGPIQGELHIIVEANSLVQFAQISSGELLDPEDACTPERIETWRRLLDSTAARLSARLTGDFTDSQQSSSVISLADTHPMQDDDLLSGESGSRIQRWLLQAGKSKIAILARAKVEFTEEPVFKAPSTSVNPDDATPPIQAHIDQQTENSDGDESDVVIPIEPGSDRASTSASEQMAPERIEMEEKEMKPEEPPRTSADGGKRQRLVRDFDDSVTPPEQTHRFDLLLDIELEATLRFGAIEMPLREVLELGPGDVLSLDRHVQEPVELVVGDRIVARGEVVLIGGNFGLHVTEVAEPRRRLETIRCLF